MVFLGLEGSVDKSSTVTTTYVGMGKYSTSTSYKYFITINSVCVKDAVQSVTGIELERLHGWYMGIDVTQATAVNVNLTNYPDIAIRNSQPVGGTNYDPYVFTLNQQIDTSTMGSPNNTPVGQTSEYKLWQRDRKSYIVEPKCLYTLYSNDCGIFRLRPTNSNISTTGFKVIGSLTQVSTRWRPSNEIMNGEVKYYQSAVSSVSLQMQIDHLIVGPFHK